MMKRFNLKTSVKAVAPVISTVVITATLLIILIIASFITANLLELQIQNTEFEQAKTNMMLLNELIMDVALRQGAASSVKFNQRAGGIGIYKSPENLTITDNNGAKYYPFNTNDAFYVLKYHGGSRVSASNMTLTEESFNITSGSPYLIVESFQPAGYVWVEACNGAWIVLDYFRVRVANYLEYDLTDIFVVRLNKGLTGGSGTVTVKVRNSAVNTETYQIDENVPLFVHFGNNAKKIPFHYGNVRITEVVVEVSIT